jgi:site-specific DNA-methyltransferase (adenine-specific)
VIEFDKVYNRDSLALMKELPAESIDLIFTSPPYANQRKGLYKSVNDKEFLYWILPFMKEIKRILKPIGSFFLNINPHARGGEKSLYVMKLVIYLRDKLGFKFIDELVWDKANAFPGDFSGRLKDAWEPVYHFSVGDTNQIVFNPYAHRVEPAESTVVRVDTGLKKRVKMGVGNSNWSHSAREGKSAKKNLDKYYDTQSENGSNFKMDFSRMVDLEFVRPSNIVRVSTGAISSQEGSKMHPAMFPEGLPSFFIPIWSDEGDVVFDPFGGVGTTALEAKRWGRRYISVDLDKRFCGKAEERLEKAVFREHLIEQEKKDMGGVIYEV